MIEFMKIVIESVLNSLYQSFGFAIIMAVLFMFLYMYAKEHGTKNIIQSWYTLFKTSTNFRKVFFLAFYTAMLLFRTLLCRYIWLNPLSNVIGVWGLYNEKGELTTETIENLVLFIPFTVLLLWSFHEKIIGKNKKMFKTLWQSIKISLLCSSTIEFLQLFLRLGTFQLSDLIFNTLGGLVGGIIYYVIYRWKRRK